MSAKFLFLRKTARKLKRYSFSHTDNVITDHVLNMSINVLINPERSFYQGSFETFTFRGNTFVLISQGGNASTHLLKRAFRWYKSQIYIKSKSNYGS